MRSSYLPNNSGNVDRILLSMYFREELKQKVWGEMGLREANFLNMWDRPLIIIAIITIPPSSPSEALQYQYLLKCLGLQNHRRCICIHEIKRCLLLGRKAMINLGSVLKKQRYHFANKGSYSQSYGFSISHVWMRELDHK